jgi:hypothetical protein
MRRFVVLGLCAFAVVAAQAEDWRPVPGTLQTRWAKDVDPKSPLPEYPRPQMVRAEWTNLNGLWDYAIADLGAARPEKFTGQILVPFPLESALSGVKKPLTGKQNLWYRRGFAAPALKDGKRLLLHFGAVDWEARVLVNGKEVGTHRGGYDAFTFDITDAVKAGADNELVVAVFDETGGMQPKGKQHFPAMAKPGGIMYTPCSGIWQTVWMEAVPAGHIESLKITPDIDAGSVTVEVAGQGEATITVLDAGQPVASAQGAKATLKIPKAKLWSPDSPFLYDVKVTLGKDEVTSYFGMRKISVAKDEKGVNRILLNNKFVFQAGPLDQGFWPDGIYTAPTDAALRYDIEVTKKLGFNMARKHVKVEPDRWYYWCDKLGLLIWQDMPSGNAGKGGGRLKDGVRVSDQANAQFEAELKAMVEQHWNHPSIVLWVVFNEGWGQYDTPRLVQFTKQLDPTRLVNNASGWNDIKSGDVVDMHNYGPLAGAPDPEPDRASVLGEFGGLGLPIPGHMWVEKAWGYQTMSDRASLTRKYLQQWQNVLRLRDEKGLNAAVYTQTTDVETESNGLLSYDREVVKMDPAIIAPAVSRGEFPPLPVYTTIVPTAIKAPVLWRQTTVKPGDNWFKPEFDDTAWTEAPAGFGREKAARTQWATADIWLRREMTLPETKLQKPVFLVFHDEDVEIYVNGVLAAKATGYTTAYEPLALTPEGRAALKPGKNQISVHCHQTIGGQFIDVGLDEEK